MSQLAAVILDSIREAADRKIFWVMLGISAFLAAAMCAIGAREDGIWLVGQWKLDWLASGASDPRWRDFATVLVVNVILAKFLGVVCIVFALIATTAGFTSELESGRIDVLLSKPLARAKIYLSKFLGGTMFMLIQSIFFVALTFLVMGIRWKLWMWNYLWAAPLVVLLFCYLSSLACLFGTVLRSAPAAMLLTIICWVFFFLAQSGYGMIKIGKVLGDSPWSKAVGAVYWLSPKTGDIPSVAMHLVQPGAERVVIDMVQQWKGPNDAERTLTPEQIEMLHVDPVKSIGSSLGFVAFMLGFGVYRFSRQDY